MSGRSRMVFLSAAILVAALSAALAGTPSEDEQKYRASVNEGVELLQTGQREEINRAIAKFKTALRLRPESAEAFYWIALAYSDQDNFIRAVEYAKDATVYDESMSEAWLLLGQLRLYLKEWNEALRALEHASRLAPDNPMVQFNLGRVYYHGFKDPDSALPKFRAVWQNNQALRRQNPANTALVLRSRLYMGYCEFDRARWANAVNAFREVLIEEPYNYDAALRLALAYRHGGRPMECDQILKSMLQVVPPDTQSHRQLLAEVNLQLADLYLKEQALKNPIFAYVHLRYFVDNVGDNHPALEAAKEYLALNDDVGAPPR